MLLAEKESWACKLSQTGTGPYDVGKPAYTHAPNLGFPSVATDVKASLIHRELDEVQIIPTADHIFTICWLTVPRIR